MSKEEQLKIFTKMFCHMCKSFGFDQHTVFKIINNIFNEEFTRIKAMYITEYDDGTKPPEW